MGYEVEESQDRAIRALRKEIIALETEVGELCKKVQALESELTLMRESRDVDQRKDH